MITYDDYAIKVKLNYHKVAIVKINISNVQRLRKSVITDEISSVGSISSKLISTIIIGLKYDKLTALLTISKDNVVVTTFFYGLTVEEKITINL